MDDWSRDDGVEQVDSGFVASVLSFHDEVKETETKSDGDDGGGGPPRYGCSWESGWRKSRFGKTGLAEADDNEDDCDAGDGGEHDGDEQVIESKVAGGQHVPDAEDADAEDADAEDADAEQREGAEKIFEGVFECRLRRFAVSHGTLLRGCRGLPQGDFISPVRRGGWYGCTVIAVARDGLEADSCGDTGMEVVSLDDEIVGVEVVDVVDMASDRAMCEPRLDAGTGHTLAFGHALRGSYREWIGIAPGIATGAGAPVTLDGPGAAVGVVVHASVAFADGAGGRGVVVHRRGCTVGDGVVFSNRRCFDSPSMRLPMPRGRDRLRGGARRRWPWLHGSGERGPLRCAS